MSRELVANLWGTELSELICYQVTNLVSKHTLSLHTILNIVASQVGHSCFVFIYFAGTLVVPAFAHWPSWALINEAGGLPHSQVGGALCTSWEILFVSDLSVTYGTWWTIWLRYPGVDWEVICLPPPSIPLCETETN